MIKENMFDRAANRADEIADKLLSHKSCYILATICSIFAWLSGGLLVGIGLTVLFFILASLVASPTLKVRNIFHFLFRYIIYWTCIFFSTIFGNIGALLISLGVMVVAVIIPNIYVSHHAEYFQLRSQAGEYYSYIQKDDLRRADSVYMAIQTMYADVNEQNTDLAEVLAEVDKVKKNGAIAVMYDNNNLPDFNSKVYIFIAFFLTLIATFMAYLTQENDSVGLKIGLYSIVILFSVMELAGLTITASLFGVDGFFKTLLAIVFYLVWAAAQGYVFYRIINDDAIDSSLMPRIVSVSVYCLLMLMVIFSILLLGNGLLRSIILDHFLSLSMDSMTMAFYITVYALVGLFCLWWLYSICKQAYSQWWKALLYGTMLSLLFWATFLFFISLIGGLISIMLPLAILGVILYAIFGTSSNHTTSNDIEAQRPANAMGDKGKSWQSCVNCEHFSFDNGGWCNRFCTNTEQDGPACYQFKFH